MGNCPLAVGWLCALHCMHALLQDSCNTAPLSVGHCPPHCYPLPSIVSCGASVLSKWHSIRL
eukprot:scaffold3005_cov109-Isochrysis_galbana.AAC.2